MRDGSDALKEKEGRRARKRKRNRPKKRGDAVQHAWRKRGLRQEEKKRNRRPQKIQGERVARDERRDPQEKGILVQGRGGRSKKGGGSVHEKELVWRIIPEKKVVAAHRSEESGQQKKTDGALRIAKRKAQHRYLLWEGKKKGTRRQEDIIERRAANL